ncbi:MAG: methyltransferase domain-containing protein [Chloroflexota bacterium]
MTLERAEAAAALTCCAALYGHPLAELVLGDSLHPGGIRGTRELLRAADLRPGSRLLDAGCGLGASARLAAAEHGLRVDAVDASAGALARAASGEASARIRWQRADVRELPFEDATFDAVLAECVLSTTDRRPALAEIHRVLRPGGRLLLSDVVADGPIDAFTAHPALGAALCLTAAWRPGEPPGALAEAGFVIDRRWDRTPAILELVDRAEARLTFATLAFRDLQIDLPTLGASLPAEAGLNVAGADLTASTGRRVVRDLAEVVRSAVRDGTLGYIALVATAIEVRRPNVGASGP